MKMIFEKVVLLLCSIFILPAADSFAQNEAHFFIAPNGSDANPGTMKKPFATIGRAQAAVRAATPKMAGDIIVFLRDGHYALAQTIIFDARDSGLNGHAVIYSAYPNESPVVHGGQRIQRWNEAGNGLFSATTDLNFRQLYVNGERAIRARTPNAGAYHRLKFWDEKHREIIIERELIQPWQRFDRIEMIPHLHWAEAILPLASFETHGPYAHIVVHEPERELVFLRPYPVKSENESFHFENALEFLDEPGEWYLDQSMRTVYYMPRPGEDLTRAEVMAPTLETLVKIAGTVDSPVHNLQFKGITFAYSGWNLPREAGMLTSQAGFYSIKVEPNNVQYFARPPAAVYVAGTHHLRFERNSFTHLGASGLDFHFATQSDIIIGNVFRDISGNGIVLAEFSGPETRHGHMYNPVDEREICTNDTISNNLITQIGRDYPGCCGIACGFPRAVVIEHNEVFDLPYTGISVGWGWQDIDNAMRDNQIRFNHIHHVLQLLCDGGGIYTLSRQPNSVIKENYIHDIYRSQWAVGSRNNGIFLDQGSDGITVTRNVFRNIQQETIRHNDTTTIISIKNDTRDQRIIDASGLQPAFRDIAGLRRR
ncbi:MAG: right-handed parallel beta-helix repeat-containing protein [Candidatus Zhuqueibacterota bacterium]